MEQKPIFNLHLTYEDAMTAALRFHNDHQELRVWKDPRNFYDQRIKCKLDGIFAKSIDEDIAYDFEVGTIEIEAKAALIWLIERHKGFNPLELGQVIVGENRGIQGDREVAIFTYLSREDDCLRDFITEKAFELTYKK